MNYLIKLLRKYKRRFDWFRLSRDDKTILSYVKLSPRQLEKREKKENRMIKKIITDKKKLAIPCEECLMIDLIIIEVFITDLIDTAKFYNENCAGLAANQIGYNLRCFVVKINNKFVPMVNPEFVSKSKNMIIAEEGCLSFPGVITSQKRHQSIKVSYYDPIKKKQIKRKKLKDIEARIFQHEMDHLDGLLI